MEKINYTITFLSDWHIGSGLAGGAELDAVVLKNKNQLPYIPGKTIKGLFRDAAMDLKDCGRLTESEIETIFGKEMAKLGVGDKDNLESFTNKIQPFFGNAELFDDVSLELIDNKLTDFLYRNMASTAISENGIAESQSLRTMQVCMPISLVGEITNIDSAEKKQLLLQAMKLIRGAGVNRNRGLGRCSIILNDQKND